MAMKTRWIEWKLKVSISSSQSGGLAEGIFDFIPTEALQIASNFKRYQAFPLKMVPSFL